MTYGCGAEFACKECYPFTYRCECGVDFEEPVPFGERIPVCEACGLDFQEMLDNIAYDEQMREFALS